MNTIETLAEPVEKSTVQKLVEVGEQIQASRDKYAQCIGQILTITGKKLKKKEMIDEIHKVIETLYRS